MQAAAHEALKQAVAQAEGSDESLRKMVDALHDDGPTKGQEVGAVLGKLDALAARIESMQAQLSHRVHVSPRACISGLCITTDGYSMQSHMDPGAIHRAGREGGRAGGDRYIYR